MWGAESVKRIVRFARKLKWDAHEALVRILLGRWSLPDSRFGVGLGVLTAPLACVAVLTYLLPLAAMHDGGVREEIAFSDQRKQGTAVYDAAQRFIGGISGRLDSDEAYNEDYEAVTYRRFLVYPDRKTLFVESPPEVYVDCLYRLEDSHLGNVWINPFGIDALGLARMPVSVLQSITSGNGINGAGGSTLANMFVQQLVRPKNRGREGPAAARRETAPEKVLRKLNEYWNVPVMHSMLSASEFRRYAQFAARHLPHVQDVAGERGTVYGVEFAAQIVFGKTAAKLTPVEQMILAASVRRQIIFDAGPSASGAPIARTDRAHRRWSRIVDRAEVCAGDPRLFPSPRERVAHLNTLQRMRQTIPTPRAHRDLEEFGRMRYGGRWPERARDPFRRADIFLYNAVRGLRAELQDAFGAEWSRRVARIDTSIDVVREREFSPAFRTHVRNWLAARSDLNPEYRPWAIYPPGDREPGQIPEVVLAVADQGGRLVRYYSAREDASYFGLIRGDDGRGAYDPSTENRQIASIAKIGAALVLAQQPNALEFVPAIAHSRTDEVTAALQRVDPGRRLSREVIRLTRWTENSSFDARRQRLDLSVGLSRGTVSADPRTVHWIVSGMLAAFTGNDGPVRPPTLVRSVSLVDLENGRLSAPFARLPDAYSGRPLPADETGFTSVEARLAEQGSALDPRELAPPVSRARLYALLRSPACNGGTLASLARWCTRAKVFFVKSGTYDVSTARGAGHATQTIWIAGGVSFVDGRSYSFVVVIGGHSLAAPLTISEDHDGEIELEASDAAPLIDFVLRDLEAHRTTTDNAT